MQPNLDEMKDWAAQSGEILMRYFRQNVGVRFKQGKFDPVTEADTASEALLIENIRSRYPDHAILTEESGLLEGEGSHTWLIDPLDGTVNFSHGLALFSISIAYAEAGRALLGVVYDPVSREFFTAERGKGAYCNDRRLHVSDIPDVNGALLVTGFPYVSGETQELNLEYYARFARCSQGVRRLGSAALDLCYVAAGWLDGYWEMQIKPWDVAAGTLIVEEAGGMVTTARAGVEYMRPPITIVAANPALHGEIIKLINA